MILSVPGATFGSVLTEIKTERLLLRRPTAEDRPALAAIESDPLTNKFNPDPPTPEKALEKVDGWLVHWAEHGFGYVAVTELDSGEVAGMTGVRRRDFHGEQVLNLGYRFSPRTWGKGYATEAAAAALEWAERELAQFPVVISVNVVNQPSLRVAERLGFTKYTEEEYDGAFSRHYRR